MAIEKLLNMEHFWNDTDSGQLKHPNKNLPYCFYFHHNPLGAAWDRTYDCAKGR
jgi:hypothetical protein